MKQTKEEEELVEQASRMTLLEAIRRGRKLGLIQDKQEYE